MSETIKFGDFRWGSCQYDTAADTYHKKLKEGLEAVNDIHFSRVRPIEEIVIRAQNYVQEWSQDILASHKENDEWATNWVKSTQEEANKLTSIEGCFDLLKNKSEDLWNAAPRVCEWVFERLQMPKIADRTDGQGPVMNVITQGENDRTGTYCALLTIHAAVDESAFIGFDT